MDLFDFLKTQNELVILGSGREELDVYDLLIGKNIDVCCFVNDNYSEQSHKMFGKNIISSIDARNKYKKPIFIECSNKYSAWGFGKMISYQSKKLEDEFKIELFFFIRAKLQKVRMMEIIGEYNF